MGTGSRPVAAVGIVSKGASRAAAAGFATPCITETLVVWVPCKPCEPGEEAGTRESEKRCGESLTITWRKNTGTVCCSFYCKESGEHAGKKKRKRNPAALVRGTRPQPFFLYFILKFSMGWN